MKKKLLILAAVVLIALAAYAIVRIPQWKTEDDIREAVFRYQIQRLGSGGKREAVYYLSVVPGWARLTSPGCTPIIDRVLGAFGLAREESNRWEGSSPSSGLVGRFSGHKPSVRLAYECRIKNANGVTDARGTKKGFVLVAGKIAWLSSAKVDVEGGYYENGMSASGNIYTVIRRHGRWVVVRDKTKWIS